MNPRRPARGDRSGRERIVVLVAAHLGQGDAAHSDGGRGRRTAERGEAGAGDDGGGGEPAADMADPGIGRVVEIAAHAGGAGDVAHQHEHRNDRKLVEARDREGFRAQRRQRMLPAADGDVAEEPGNQHRQADRHAQDEQQEQPGDADEPDRGVAHGRLSRERPFSGLCSIDAAFIGQQGPRRSAQHEGLREQHQRIEPDPGAEREIDRLERDVEEERAFAEPRRGASGDEEPPAPDRRDDRGEQLDEDAVDPLEARTEQGLEDVGGDVGAGAAAIGDGRRHDQHQERDRQVERAVERAVEHIAAGDVDHDDAHQDEQQRTAAIERHRPCQPIDDREHCNPPTWLRGARPPRPI